MEKSFGPQTLGVLFGMYYDTVVWTLGISNEEMVVLATQIQHILQQDRLSMDGEVVFAL
jgi:hypothetical protein